MVLIPLSQTPGQTLNVVLNGQNCTITLYWRQERLYLDLNVGSRNVCQGAICQNLTGIVQSPSRFFSGNLHFVDLEGNRPPRWEKLHTGNTGRYALLFLEESDVLRAEQGA